MTHINWGLAPQKLPSSTSHLFLQRKVALRRATKLVDITDTEDFFFKYTATSPDPIPVVVCIPVHLGPSHNTHSSNCLVGLGQRRAL